MHTPYRYLAQRFIAWLRQSASFLWLIVVAGYLMVLAGNATYRTYVDNRETADLQAKLGQARLERDRLQALLVYYRTDSYKEKQLRADLLLKMPDEEAYALPESSVARTLEEDAAESAPQAKKSASGLPVWRQWLDYLWNGER